MKSPFGNPQYKLVAIFCMTSTEGYKCKFLHDNQVIMYNKRLLHANICTTKGMSRTTPSLTWNSKLVPVFRHNITKCGKTLHCYHTFIAKYTGSQQNYLHAFPSKKARPPNPEIQQKVCDIKVHRTNSRDRYFSQVLINST